MPRADRISRQIPTASRALCLAQTLGLAAALVCAPAWALYKVVGPDGKVTYTDRPPTNVPSQTIKTNGATVESSSLPFALREVVAKYPVTLYSSRDCAPCDLGRSLLQRRGVPYVEKSVETREDIEALKRLEGAAQVPVLRVGQQQVKGFLEREWLAYLDAAGYPKQSALPPGYAWRSPTPLVQAVDAPTRAKPIAPIRPEAPIAPPVGQPAVPPGFRF